MSPLPTRMTLRKEVVLNSVAEFLGIWAVRGEASLSLNTKDGVTTIAFTHSFSGHPEDPLHPPPAPTQRRRRHRGPARRERDRQRAARHQAAQMSQAGASPASPPSGATFQCDQCEKTFKTEPGLKIHTGKAHKKGDSTPPPPDRLRQHPGSPATLPSSPLLDASREEVAEVVMVEPTPPRLPPSSRTSSEESDTSSPLELPSACPGIFIEVGGGETGCGYCGRGGGKKCDWPWLKKQFRMTKEGLKAIEDD